MNKKSQANDVSDFFLFIAKLQYSIYMYLGMYNLRDICIYIMYNSGTNNSIL